MNAGTVQHHETGLGHLLVHVFEITVHSSVCWPLTSIQRLGYEWEELYVFPHTPSRDGQGHLYLYHSAPYRLTTDSPSNTP